MYPNPAGDAFQVDGVWYQDYNIQDPTTGEVRVKRYKYVNNNWVEAVKVDLSKNILNTVAGISLKKNVANLDKCLVNLSKSNGIDLGAHSAKVAVVIDYSGSMHSLYRNGAVQRTLNRLVPLGLRFDDNGELDVWLFDNRAMRMEGMDLSNFENYVDEIINKSGYRMGGTSYSPVIDDVMRKYCNEEPNQFPAFIIFITDGANDDRRKTDDAIKRSSYENVFFQFVGLGYSSFDYLEKLDDLKGRPVDNTGFIKVYDFDKMSDDQLYKELIPVNLSVVG